MYVHTLEKENITLCCNEILNWLPRKYQTPITNGWNRK